MSDLTYVRSNDTFSDGVANGRRGTVKVGEKSWYSIERMDDFKWLRPGEYSCEFGLWTSSSGKKREAIRVLGSYSNGRIYFHPANEPQQLAGCIAPGNSINSTGVSSSRVALSEIFTALGGYVAGKKFTLSIEGNMYDTLKIDDKSIDENL
jgi:hypothetical protein